MAERRMQHWVVVGLSMFWESQFLENRHGILDDRVWDQRLGTIAGLLDRKPAYSEVWNEIRTALSPAFVQAVELARESGRTTAKGHLPGATPIAS